jgi:hypothetical protein
MIVTDLTDESHGNGIGVGLADVITRNLYDKIDWPETYRNTITSSFLDRAKTPIVADTPHEAFDIALRSCGFVPPGEERIVRIVDTLHLQTLHVSRVIAEGLRDSPHFSVDTNGTDLFDSTGALTPLEGTI